MTNRHKLTGETPRDPCPACGKTPAYTPPDYPCPHFTVKYTARTKFTGERADIRCRRFETISPVTVTGPELRYGGEVVGAEVNWSAVGSVDRLKADDYAELIRFTARAIAPALDPSEDAADALLNEAREAAS